jgi:hypothetical protein
MTAFRLGILSLAVTLLLSVGPVLAQRPTPDCPQPSASVGSQPKPPAPEKIEGTVTAIDAASGTVTVQASDGQTHQFRGNKETVGDLKVGDRIDMNLRQRAC